MLDEIVLDAGLFRMNEDSFPINHAGAHVGARAHVRPGADLQHDIGKAPWPARDGEYDLVVALQVWEHLEGRQRQAFAEARRVGRRVLLSLPYLWQCPGDCHHGIDDDMIFGWTGERPAKMAVATGRIVLLYDVKEE